MFCDLEVGDILSFDTFFSLERIPRFGIISYRTPKTVRVAYADSFNSIRHKTFQVEFPIFDFHCKGSDLAYALYLNFKVSDL